MNNWTTFIVLSLCCGAMAMTLTKSRFFRAPRKWIVDRSDFWGEMAQCPFCMAHHLAVITTAMWRLRLVDCGFAPLDYAATAAALVGASALIGGIIFRLFTSPSVSPDDLQAVLKRALEGK